jgi:hypothetical protein
MMSLGGGSGANHGLAMHPYLRASAAWSSLSVAKSSFLIGSCCSVRHGAELVMLGMPCVLLPQVTAHSTNSVVIVVTNQPA